MATSSFAVENFKGLRLDVDPQELGLNGAVDLLNVDFDKLGAVRTRNGSAKWDSSAISSTGYQAMFPSPTNGGEFILIRGVAGGPTLNIDRMPDGNTITNIGSVAVNAFPVSSAVIGTTTTTTIYFTLVTNLAAGVQVRKYDGTTLGTGTGKPTHVATWPTSNRLAQGGYFAAADSPSGANGSRSTVFFSDPGAPDTYGANNFVTLRPGDGEGITGIVSWRDLLFVFKESSVFVFYGESTDSAGNPVFNYRRVDLPSPILDQIRQLAYAPIATAGPDAVYYSTPRGIYRTAGGVPELFTGAVAGIFSADTSFGSALRTNGFAPGLAWVTDRLIVSYTNAASAVRQLVYHAPSGQWTVWSLGGSVFSTAPAHLGVNALNVAEGFWFVNGNDVWTCSPLSTTDGGSAISWSYKSGLYAISDPGRVTCTLESKLTGVGTVTMKVATTGGSSSSAGVLDTGSALTLGSSVSDDGYQQIDREGSLFQHELSGSGVATVSRLVHYMSFVKPPGVQ